MLDRANAYFKEKIQLAKLMSLKRKVLSNVGFCSLELFSNHFALSYLTPANGQHELQFCKSYSFEHIESLQTALTKAVKENGLDGVKCSWILRPKHYQLILTEALPVASPAEFQTAIRWKIKDSLVYPVEDAVIDKFDLPEQVGAANKMIAVTVARKSYLEPFSAIINHSGLKLISIDIPELALRNLTALYEEDKKSSAFIYLQEKRSELIITHCKKLYFYRYLDLSVDALDPAKTTDEEMQNHFDKLTLEIQRSFDYYQSQWRHPSPQRVFLACSQWGTEKIVADLSHKLSLPVHLFDIKEQLPVKQNLTIDEQGKFLVIIGGVLRELIKEHDSTD